MHTLMAVSADAETTNSAAMEDERHNNTPGRRENRSPWNDPRTWVGICALMLTILSALLGFISTQLAQINASIKSTNDAVLIVTTKQTGDNKSLEDRVAKLENAVTTQQQAYNFNFASRLAGVEAALKLNQGQNQNQRE